MRIFISYGRGDAQEFARKLATWLKAQGFTPWLDIDEGIPIGSPFDVRIELGIERSDLLIALLSPWSLRQEGFCRNELLFAQAKKRPIIPVRIANVIPPIQIISLNYVDAYAEPDTLFRELPGLIQLVARSGRMPLRDWPADVSARPWWIDAKHLSFQEELARHGGGFIGREWLFRQLEDWIVNPDSRFLLMTADAGVGKSAIAAQMTARLNVRGVHFCSRSQAESCRFRSWLAALIHQLASQFPCFERLLTALGPPVWEDPPVPLFRSLVTQPLSECIGELDITEPWVFVVDALDESLAEAGPDLADLLAESVERLPPWFRIIATSRPDRSLMARFVLNSVRHSHLNAECEPNREDLTNYLHGRLEGLAAAGAVTADVPALTSRIVSLADGNFLYARMTLDAITDPDESSRLKLENLGELPSKLGGLYSAMFRRRFTVAERYEAQVLPLLDCLVAARSPLPEGTLTSASGLNRRVAQQGLRQLSQFLSADAGGLRLFHQSVADWLTDDPASAEFAALPASGHEHLAEAGWREFKAGVAGMSSYMTRHLPEHLAQASRAEDLTALLSTPNWLKRKLALSDPHAVVADYDRLPKESALRAIQGAVRISAHILALHPEQLAAQLLGRLGDRNEPELAAFLRVLRDSQGPGWSLLPRAASLRSPDGGTLSSWRIDEVPETCHVAFSPDGLALAFVTRAGTNYRRVDTGAIIFPESFEHPWQEAESANWRDSVSQTSPPALPDNQRDWSFRRKWACTTLPGSSSARIVVDWVRINTASRSNSGPRYKDLVAQEVFVQEAGRWHRIEGTELAMPATAVAVSRNGDFLAIATIDGTLNVWRLPQLVTDHRGGRCSETGEFWRVREPQLCVRQGGGAVQAIAVSACGDKVATLNTGGLVTFWATTGASHSINYPLASASGPDDLLVLSGGTRAFVVDQDRGLAAWDTHSGKRLAYIEQDLSMGSRIKLMISPDVHFVLSVDVLHDMYDGFLIQVLDVEEGRLTLKFETEGPKREDYASLPQECWSVEGRLYALPAPKTGCLDLATGTFVDSKVATGPTAKVVPWREVEYRADDPWCSIMERGWSASVRVPLVPVPLTFTVDDEISRVAMAPDGSCVVVGCRSGIIHFLELRWNLASDDATRRQVEEAFGSPSARLRCIAARTLSGGSEAWAKTLLQQAADADPEPLVRRTAVLAMAAVALPAVLRGYLSDPSLIVREAVVDVLAQLGDAGGLIMAFGDADQNQRRRAADALGKLDSTDAGDALEGLLKDPNPGVAMAARMGIVRRGGPRAIALLVHPETDRKWALEELSRMATPPAILAMVRLMEGGCSESAKALERLGWQPPADPVRRARYAIARHQWDEAVRTGAAAIPELVKQLQMCRNAWEAKAPADALRRIGDSSAIAPLLRLLTNASGIGDDGVVGQGGSVHLLVADIAETLVAIGGAPVRGPLLAAYQAGNSFTKVALLRPLAVLGGQEAGTIIASALSETGGLAGPAARAAAFYPERKLVMAALLVAAEGGEPDAIDVLASMQEQRAIPALIRTLDSGSGRARSSAAAALVKIAGETALPVFQRALDSELQRRERDRDFQFLAAIASGLSALASPAVVPQMLTLLRCSSASGADPAYIAAKGLMSLVPADKLIPLLVGSLRMTSYGCLDSVGVLRLVPKALDALPEGAAIGDIEQAAEKLAQAMSPGLWDYLQEEVADILGRFGEPAIPTIARRLENADWQIRRHLIHALAAMQSTRAIPLLASAVDDEYAHVRVEAVKGLFRLGTSEALAALKVEGRSGPSAATHGPQPAQ